MCVLCVIVGGGCHALLVPSTILIPGCSMECPPPLNPPSLTLCLVPLYPPPSPPGLDPRGGP